MISERIKEEMKKAAQIIQAASDKVDESFEQAVELLYQCKGKVVVSGMGKTGHIGRKISATLASTGTTSIFLHAAEGIHGDLGIVDKQDVLVAISYTGNSSELVSILPYFKFHRIPIVAITGNENSKLGQNADVVLKCNVGKGMEPFDLVPTMSTTLSLVIGDALAVALLEKKAFHINDFARVHPGGTIGKRLLLRVEDLAHTGKAIPKVNEQTKLKDTILEMTSKKLGCAGVINKNNELVGIVTDGDLRRYLSVGDFSEDVEAQKIMTVNPKCVAMKLLAVEALNLMEDCKITVLPIVDENKKLNGFIHMHDLIDAGVVG